jgi:hypothetical protein
MNTDQVHQFRDLWNSYSGDRIRLRKVVDELAGYQASLKAKSASPNRPEPGPGSDHKLHLVGLLLLIVLAGLGFVVHALRSRTRTNPGSVRTP